jgi:hypothetical protein
MSQNPTTTRNDARVEIYSYLARGYSLMREIPIAKIFFTEARTFSKAAFGFVDIQQFGSDML